MAMRIYRDQKTGKVVHAKPSESQPGIIVYYPDRQGKPRGRCQAATVEEFNERFQLGASAPVGAH